jgi:hypothetical protein
MKNSMKPMMAMKKTMTIKSKSDNTKVSKVAPKKIVMSKVLVKKPKM